MDGLNQPGLADYTAVVTIKKLIEANREAFWDNGTIIGNGIKYYPGWWQEF